MRDQRTLREAWQATIVRLGRTEGGQTLLLGPRAEILADQHPGPTAGSTTEVATLGGGTVPDGATPTTAGLPDGSFDSTVALSAWDSPAAVGAVADEAL